MGNSPAHHKRRASGDIDFKSAGTSPYTGVILPPSKKRNIQSLGDFSNIPEANILHSEDQGMGIEEMAAALEREAIYHDLIVTSSSTGDVENVDASISTLLQAASLTDQRRDATKDVSDADRIDPSIGHSELPYSSRLPNNRAHLPLLSVPATGRPARVGMGGSAASPSPAISASLCIPAYHGLASTAFPFSFPISPGADPLFAHCRSFADPVVTSFDMTSDPGHARLNATDSTESKVVPTVFRWNGGGDEIYLSGTFNNWEKDLMVKRNSGVSLIVDCPPGKHEYKFFIDGAWYHDPTKPTIENQFGTRNNIVEIKKSDFHVLDALRQDIVNSRSRARSGDFTQSDSMCYSPPGEYSQFIPAGPADVPSVCSRQVGPPAPGIGTDTQPPLLPPQLSVGILNQSVGAHCDPNLLPSPNHVMVNHLYALSIKDGVIVLSVISRYRQKFVSTLFYKPIND